jgi:hypothetical protein
MRWYIPIAAAFALSACSPAYAQEAGPAPTCIPYAEAVANLKHKFHEEPVGRGIALDEETVVEVFAAPGGKTWTAVVVHPDGMACSVGAGYQWEALPFPLPGDPT